MITRFFHLRAFTLIEILVTVGILAISITAVSSWTISMLSRSEFQTTAETVVSMLRKLEIAAQSGISGTPHGIKLESHHVHSFEGLRFDDSNPLTRTDLRLASPLVVQNILLRGGGSEVIFAFATGETVQDGFFQVANSETNESATITISPLGLIDWL